MQIKLTKGRLEWLNDNHILFSNNSTPRLSLGDVLVFEEHVKIEPYVGFNSGLSVCEIGFMSYTNSAVPTNIKIGRYCSLAGNIRIGGFRHPIEHLSTSIFTYDRRNELVNRFSSLNKPAYNSFKAAPQKGPVSIEHDVWIGRDASIMTGVTIGTGSVVASAAVVTKNVPPYSIVGGNPAKLLRKRFSDDTIEELLRSQWWQYKFSDFEGMNIFNPEEFLKEFKRRKNELAPYVPQIINFREILQEM